MADTKQIAKNTIMLYFRQIIVMIVNLYAVRVVLNVLGAADYGIYNTIGGIVTFFSFLSGTMASATQRFFSFALGEDNQDKLNKTFSTNIIIYLIIIFVAVALLESVGSWFVYNKLKIPSERFDAACWIFHFSVLTFMFSIISSPLMAIVIAHEDMHIYAYVSIAEVFMRLAAVFLLRLFLFDKLKLYVVLLCVVGAVNAGIYLSVCFKKYKECQFKHFYFDRHLFKETLDFTGWALFGSITTVFRTQAVTILVNQVFNPIIVAARSVAIQIANAINVFSTNFNTGLYPSIVKSYAKNNKEEMFHIIFMGCKMTFFLLWIFALPAFLEMDFVIRLWLKNPPEFSILFTRLALFEVMINSVSLPISTAARAFGKMKKYELTLGIIQLLIFAADFILFKYFNVQAFIVFVVAAAGNLVMFVFRLFLIHQMINFPLKRFALKVAIPLSIFIIFSAGISFLIDSFLPNTFIYVALSVLISVSVCVVLMFFLVLSSNERSSIILKIKNKIKRCV